MEEDDANLKIVECLRGRLLAERAASKAAKLDEHLLDSKVKELEAQLKRETKARKRFERKLSFLKSKIQSLNLPPLILEDSEESRTSSSSIEDNSDSSCISSIASTSSKSPSHDESLHRPTNNNTNTSSDQGSECHPDELNTFEACPSQELPQMDKESADSETGSPRSKLEMEDDNGDTRENQEEEDEVDNSMALVPLSFPDEHPEDLARKEEVVKISSESVREVLGTLKHIREEIQRTMQKRQATRQMQMIQVG